MPSISGQDIIRNSFETNVHGLIKSNFYTMKTDVKNVYAIGDAAAISIPFIKPAGPKPHPKSGTFAIAQAKTVAKDILNNNNDEWNPNHGIKNDYQAQCWAEIGNNNTLTIDIKLFDNYKEFLPSKQMFNVTYEQNGTFKKSLGKKFYE